MSPANNRRLESLIIFIQRESAFAKSENASSFVSILWMPASRAARRISVSKCPQKPTTRACGKVSRLFFRQRRAVQTARTKIDDDQFRRRVRFMWRNIAPLFNLIMQKLQTGAARAARSSNCRRAARRAARFPFRGYSRHFGFRSYFSDALKPRAFGDTRYRENICPTT